MKRKNQKSSNTKEQTDRMQNFDGDTLNSIDEARTFETYFQVLKEMEKVDSSTALMNVKQKTGNQKIRKWRLTLQKVAAVLILPILSVTVWQGLKLASIKESAVFNTISTNPTLRSEFTLPDGTKVWMNGNTTITYPIKFDGNERLLSMVGEAYFTVAKNKQKPFIVNINGLLVEATGTQFNIAAYPDDKTNEVLLTEGSVIIHLSKNNERKFLTKLNVNEMARFDLNNRQLMVNKVNPEKYIAWKNGKIIFQNDPLNVVIKKLERWYNVRFTNTNITNLDYAFTGTFYGEDINKILRCIELTTPIHFKAEQPKKDNNNKYDKTIIAITNKHK